MITDQLILDLKQQIPLASASVESYRNWLALVNQQLGEAYAVLDIRALIYGRAHLIDALLVQLWQHHIKDESTSLIAVGGYGRGELHPGSDIDLLILLALKESDSLGSELSNLITFLWDMGLKLGQSVRTIEECIDAAANDITITTNLLESRLLCGNPELFEQLKDQTGPEKIWPTAEFFKAKVFEQTQRHSKYDDELSNLEPNIKESPGGLRDIQVIGWVAKRFFAEQSLEGLIKHNFLTREEFEALRYSEETLWEIRFLLHIETNRTEDRLLFDYQRSLAAAIGYQDEKENLAVEKFMQKYYRTATRVRRLNDLLLQLFDESILHENSHQNSFAINRRFHIQNGYIGVTDFQLFSYRPIALMELFLVIARTPGIKGVVAQTSRLIYQHLDLIDNSFRHSKKAQQIFMDILREHQSVVHVLRLMNRYGVLAGYIPQFANAVGRMQYDLFHIFTVDRHTLEVIKNVNHFFLGNHANDYPLCTKVASRIQHPELLMIAALFHDIAKGRGGDHSELGAQDIKDFCRLHGFDQEQTDLLSWLVKNHLAMSITAQRKDIDDSTVIAEFADLVQSQDRLDQLFLLTHADIRGTNPQRWNNWKGVLLETLYKKTKAKLAEDQAISYEDYELEQVKKKQFKVLALLQGEFDYDLIISWWASLSMDYFLQHSVNALLWQTRIRLKNIDRLPVIKIRQTQHGTSELLIIDKDRASLFAITTVLLNQLGLNIINARIETSDTGITINGFLVLERDNQPINTPVRIREVIQYIEEHLYDMGVLEKHRFGMLPRRHRHFETATQITINQDAKNNRTILHIQTLDYSGLLARIALIFDHLKIRLHNAKISTIGERVDDSFYITTIDNLPVNNERLLADLYRELYEIDEQS